MQSRVKINSDSLENYTLDVGYEQSEYLSEVDHWAVAESEQEMAVG